MQNKENKIKKGSKKKFIENAEKPICKTQNGAKIKTDKETNFV